MNYLRIAMVFIASILVQFQTQAQDLDHIAGTRLIKSDIYRVWYNETYQQPVRVTYEVLCPVGDTDRAGMNFYAVDSVQTSNNADYANNVWDKGHMAPAADFNCTEEMLLMTFSYLNCALQHEGLNRGPWKELERFERDLAKVFPKVHVIIDILFEDQEAWLETGALVPSGFIKTIIVGDEEEAQNTFRFRFPNQDVAGEDWFNFKVAE